MQTDVDQKSKRPCIRANAADSTAARPPKLRDRLIHLLAASPAGLSLGALVKHLGDSVKGYVKDVATYEFGARYHLKPEVYRELRIDSWPEYDDAQRTQARANAAKLGFGPAPPVATPSPTAPANSPGSSPDTPSSSSSVSSVASSQASASVSLSTLSLSAMSPAGSPSPPLSQPSPMALSDPASSPPSPAASSLQPDLAAHSSLQPQSEPRPSPLFASATAPTRSASTARVTAKANTNAASAPKPVAQPKSRAARKQAVAAAVDSSSLIALGARSKDKPVRKDSKIKRSGPRTPKKRTFSANSPTKPASYSMLEAAAVPLSQDAQDDAEARATERKRTAPEPVSPGHLGIAAADEQDGDAVMALPQAAVASSSADGDGFNTNTNGDGDAEAQPELEQSSLSQSSTGSQSADAQAMSPVARVPRQPIGNVAEFLACREEYTRKHAEYTTLAENIQQNNLMFQQLGQQLEQADSPAARAEVKARIKTVFQEKRDVVKAMARQYKLLHLELSELRTHIVDFQQRTAALAGQPQPQHSPAHAS